MSNRSLVLPFVKMHGLGNDFVLLDHLDQPWEITPAMATFLAHRRFGIGCDQVVQLLPPTGEADAEMRIFNPDGSRAEMCGNAVRCVARYLRTDRGMNAEELRIETLAGMIRPRPLADGQIAVDMGEPRWQDPVLLPTHPSGQFINQLLWVEDQSFLVTALSMGNPHCVLFVQEAADFPLEQLGSELMNHSAFPRRTNVEVVQILDRHHIRMRVYERGAGITLACGTGACAAAVAAAANGLSDRQVTVHLDGGDLLIHWRTENNHVIMTGFATEVFRGTVTLEP